MKIFSNFDSKWKEEAYQEAVQKFGESQVYILHKSKLFLFIKVVAPILLWTLLFMALQFPVYLGLDEFGNIKYVVTGILFIAYIFTISPAIKCMLDYRMDFTLVTPEILTRYNQSGFFKRDIKSSYVKNIKTISIEKNNIRYNIFDNGNLLFLSEGDRDNSGEITLHYVQNPEETKKEIIRIMKL